MKALSLITILIFSFATPLHASENLEQILTRLKITQTKLFSYTETREMQLLKQAWEARGLMYLSPDQAVIAEQSPGKRVSTVSESSMAYVDLDRNVKYERAIEDKQQMPGFGAFLILFHNNDDAGDELNRHFKPELEYLDQRWQITLTPRQTERSGRIASLQMSGNKNQDPDQLMITSRSGDLTTWKLNLISTGTEADKTIEPVLNQIASISAK